MGRCLLGLYVGTKNVVGTLYDPAGYELLVVRPMLNKEVGDISSLATQLQHIIEHHNVCKVVVGPWPRSMNEEQAENDLIAGAAKIDRFIEALHKTGILKDDVKHVYYGVRVVLNELAVRRRVRQVKLEGRKEFSGDETDLFEQFSDTYASQFMLMHYLELAGDEAYRDSQPARESSIPGAITIDGIENTAVLTYHLSGVGCLGKAFPAGPPPAGPPPES
ncbi:hypothetical protein LWI29_001473 [Acer saccharum]|uniref:Uncharacterized protein n=1 Tax=Acer saccharum TaxID=4024 RepID=A0AA39VWD8_ACESA|nr:hypothetical protein LWI29_001473 [Acer saccharum]